MKPREFAKLYRSLSVIGPGAGGPLRVDVSRYLTGTAHQSEGWAIIAALRDGDAGVDVDTGAISRAFTGKGSPEDLVHALGCALHARRVPPDAGALQRWADAWLGVDGIGFASAYLLFERKIGAHRHHVPLYFNRGVRLRRSIWDVRSGDLMIGWDVKAGQEVKSAAGMGQVALVDVNYYDNFLLDTTEVNGSAGQGPGTAQFRVDDWDETIGQWWVTRTGPDPSTLGWKVAIIDPW